MTDIIKIFIIAITGVSVKAFVKNIKSEYSIFVTFGCVLIIFSVVLPDILSFVREMKNIISLSDYESENILIFLKCTLICETCVMAKSFCRDNNENFLSSCIDLAEKVTVLIVSLPLFKAVFEIIKGLIGY